MTLIDQRILIPAPMAAVWNIVADHQSLPKWRDDCRTLSVLSTNTEGPNVRRRITPPKGKDFLEEFKAWYNGFGFEYQVIDNRRYQYNLSRMRLQATPDGTVVQWTIEFDMRGWWARIFRKGRERRRLDGVVIRSLRQLRRHVMSTGVVLDDVHRARTGVQDAPDVSKRAEYGSSIFATSEAKGQDHASAKPKATVSSKAANVVIAEPPIRADDTPSVPQAPPPAFVRQNFDVTVDPETDAGVEESAIISEPDTHAEDTKPTRPVGVSETDTEDEPEAKSVSPSTTLTSAEKAKQRLTNASTKKPQIELSVLPDALKSIAAENLSEVAGKPSSTSKVSDTPFTQPPSEEPVQMLPPPVKMHPPSSATEETKPKRPETMTDHVTGQSTTPNTSARPVTPDETTDDVQPASIWEVFGVERPTDVLASQTTMPAQPSPSETESEAPRTFPYHTQTAKKPETLDEWLAMEEPPLPASASSTVKTFVKPSQKPMQHTGLRKRQRQQKANIRRRPRQSGEP